MALIVCPECSTQVSDKAISCPSCGCPIAAAPQQPPVAAPMVSVTKTRGTYIILAILFGGLGFHNFYAGHVVSGAIKLVLFLITFVMDLSTGFYSAFSLVWLAIAWFWALVEAFAVKEDIRGNPLH